MLCFIASCNYTQGRRKPACSCKNERENRYELVCIVTDNKFRSTHKYMLFLDRISVAMILIMSIRAD